MISAAIMRSRRAYGSSILSRRRTQQAPAHAYPCRAVCLRSPRQNRRNGMVALMTPRLSIITTGTTATRAYRPAAAVHIRPPRSRPSEPRTCHNLYPSRPPRGGAPAEGRLPYPLPHHSLSYAEPTAPGLRLRAAGNCPAIAISHPGALLRLSHESQRLVRAPS